MGGLNLLDNLFHREIDTSFNSEFRKRYVFSKASIDHLNLDAELKGHEGCVNCLEWNQSGTLLASGSDDLKINIWNPFKKKLMKSVETKHTGNIFSLKFVPGTNDSLIASAAADTNIYVYDLNRNVYLHEIHSHRNRVKRLATSTEVPFLFWSCGEDGLILQHDIRCSSNEVTQLLLNYSDGTSQIEAKCLALNQVRPELIAVGNNDPYARVYDRRMIKLRSLSNRNSAENGGSSSHMGYVTGAKSSKHLFEFALEDDTVEMPITYYTPGHLPTRIQEYQKRMKTLSITFLSFSPDGNELLVNLGGEQLYLFDLAMTGSSKRNQLRFDSFRESLKYVEVEEPKTDSDTSNNTKKKYKLPPKAEEIKILANASFEQANFVEAIDYYNIAIQICPDSPILYGNRAASLMKRNWDGDYYIAMLDCYKALSLDKMHLKSHFRLVRCLYELKWYTEAKECLDIFINRFPAYANTNACDSLLIEINTKLEKLKSKSNSKNGSTSEDSDSESSDNEYDQYLTKKKKPDSNSETSSTKSNESVLDEAIIAEKKKRQKTLKSYLAAKENAVDLKSRFCGHCNVSTDIKEACFLGSNYISAGSDDGSFFIWDRTTTNVVRVLRGDESIVNCLQPHPFDNMLATSGIDPLVRIWTPQMNEENMNERDSDRVVTDVKEAALNNQRQMNSHPFEFLLLNLAQSQNAQEEGNDTNREPGQVACRPS